jgi:hypothetical protein
MARRFRLVLLAAVAATVLTSSAWAIERGWPARSHRYVMPGAQPSPRMVPHYVNPYQRGYEVGVPTFQWGYFGARHRAHCSFHKRSDGRWDWIRRP